MKKFVAIVALLLLSACAGTLPPDFSASHKKVAVLSFVGHDFNSLEIAVMVFGNDFRRDDISDWGIDAQVEAKATELLATKFEVVPFEHRPTPLNGGEFVVDIFPGDVRDVIRAQPGFATAAGIDAYIVFIPERRGLTPTNQISEGIGMTQRFQFGENEHILHALYDVMVLDGRTLDMLTRVSSWGHVPFADPFKNNPARPVPASYWSESFDTLTDAQKKTIAADAMTLIDAVLPRTLKAAGLLP